MAEELAIFQHLARLGVEHGVGDDAKLGEILLARLGSGVDLMLAREGGGEGGGSVVAVAGLRARATWTEVGDGTKVA